MEYAISTDANVFCCISENLIAVCRLLRMKINFRFLGISSVGTWNSNGAVNNARNIWTEVENVDR